MKFKHLILTFLSLLIFNACSTDDDNCCPEPEMPEAEFADGLFVLNEGNFGSGNASVSFINENSGSAENDIFATVNGRLLGDTSQSISFFEDMAFVIQNVSNTIEVVNRNTFESIATIDNGLQNPRFSVVSNDNLYVTNWGDGSNPDDDYVAVIDLNSFSISKNISVVEGPETILETNNQIFVAHKGGFSFNNRLSVINTETNEVSKEIEVGDLPESLLVVNDQLWVLNNGKPSYAMEETAGSISKIDLNSLEVAETLSFASTTDHPENLKLSGSRVFYTLNKEVYSLALDQTTFSSNPEFPLNEVQVLYGLEISDGKLYAASANSDFTGNGNLYIYNLDNGSLLNSFSTGINPTAIYFN